MHAMLGAVNAYIIRGSKGVAMVDCGVKDEAGIKILSQTLHNFGLSFSDIETLFLTHHHADHAGLARFLQQQGAKVMMSAADAESLRDYYLHPETDNERLLLSRRHGVPDDISRASLAAYNYFRNLGEAVTPDITVNDGECISLGDSPLIPYYRRGIQRDIFVWSVNTLRSPLPVIALYLLAQPTYPEG